MFFSIIIATYNSQQYIKQTLDSIKNQNYKNFEIIVVDKKSTDKTVSIIKNYKFKNIKYIIKNDKGIYDALNTGIKNSTGDVISILHSNDCYYNKNVLKNLHTSFKLYKVDIIYGDLVYFDKKMKRLLRFWKSGRFKCNSFEHGWSPPHPSFFVKKNIYIKKGFYKTNLGNSADIELMHRFLEKDKIRHKYINQTFVKMRYGGESNKSLSNIIKQNIQIINFLNLKNNYINILKYIFLKIKNRILQFINKP